MTHDKYDTDILKTLKSIKEFLNSLHRKMFNGRMRDVSKDF